MHIILQYPYFFEGVTTAKQRNYACASCNKAYIGKGGLSRHYRLNPSHGSLPAGEDVSTQGVFIFISKRYL